MTLDADGFFIGLLKIKSNVDSIKIAVIKIKFILSIALICKIKINIIFSSEIWFAKNMSVARTVNGEEVSCDFLRNLFVCVTLNVFYSAVLS